LATITVRTRERGHIATQWIEALRLNVILRFPRHWKYDTTPWGETLWADLFVVFLNGVIEDMYTDAPRET